MDLIQAKIAEVKNLNLIYFFTTDSILRNKSEKYVGVTVVYNKDKTFTLDYKSEHFEEFIQRILDRYNKEKNKRKIILLGDLTKKLVQDTFFTIVEKKKEFIQPSGILVNNKKNQVRGYEKYLEKTLKIILKSIKNYDCVNIDSIDGFNYKYVVNYSIGNIKKQFNILIFVKEDGNVDFRISNIEGTNVNINGYIEDNFTNIKVNWYDDVQKYKGIITYDTKEQSINEKLYKNEEPIISKEYVDTLLEEDETIISFYMGLCGLEQLQNVMKIEDNCYFLSNDDILIKEKEGIVYDDISCQISIFDNDVIIKQRKKCGISKYNEQINAVLVQETNEFTIKKIEINNNFYILIEKRTNENGNISYKYSVLSLFSNENLFMPFNISDKHNIEEELKTFDAAKQYIKKRSGGKK